MQHLFLFLNLQLIHVLCLYLMLDLFISFSVKAVEVLWTPQDETDSLSEEELLEDYPLLRPI